MIFSVDGKRVTVAGAARSGLAAAELLAGRGADVTLSDTRADVPGTDRLRGDRWRGQARGPTAAAPIPE